MIVRVKNIILFGVIAAFVAALFSCTPKTELKVTGSSSVSASSTGGEYGNGISITANFPWSATTSAPWIKITEQGGNTLRFTVAENTTYEAREGSINIVCNELSHTINVVQPQNNGMLLSKNLFEVKSEGEQIEVEVKYNVDYKITMPAGVDWVSEVATKGLSSRKHIFAVKANESKLQREALISFAGGNLKEDLQIVQNGQKTIFSITHNASLFVIPTFEGLKVAGSVLWGDGKSSDFAPGLSHQYTSSGEYIVTFNLDNAQSFKLENLVGVSMIDMRGL